MSGLRRLSDTYPTGTGGNTQLLSEPGLGYFPPGGLKKFRAAVAKVRGGSSTIARVGIYGDSQSGGYQAGDATSLYTRSYGYRAMQINNTRMMRSTRGLMFPSVRNGASNPEWTFGTGWSILGSQGAFGSAQAANTATGALSVAANNVNAFDVYYVQYSGGATVGLAVDGGSVTTYNTNGSTATVKATITAGTVGTHTVSITSSGASGTNYILAVEAYDNTQTAEVRYSIFGGNAAASGDFATNTSLVYERDYTLFTMAPPNLVLWNLGTNDHTLAVTASAYQASMASLVAKTQAAGADVILVAPPASGGGTSSTWADYRDALLRVAQTYGCGFVDMQARWDAYSIANAAPYSFFADTDHPSVTGYADMGVVAAAAIRRAAGDI